MQRNPRRLGAPCLYSLTELLVALLGIRLRVHLLQQQKPRQAANTGSFTTSIEEDLSDGQKAMSSVIMHVLKLIGCSTIPRPSGRDCKQAGSISPLPADTRHRN